MYKVFRVGSGLSRPPVLEGEANTLRQAQDVARKYLTRLYPVLPIRIPAEMDIWVDIEDEANQVVESWYPSHGRARKFVVLAYPGTIRNKRRYED